MFAEPEFWVAVAFVMLMAVFAYFGIHRTALKTLDNRSDRIKAELDDARRLKEEAAKLLAEYKARHATAEREAHDIIASAQAEAERIASEAKTKMEDFVTRRTRSAESKIALAEAQALGDGGIHHPVAIGERPGRRRSPDQGHCRSSRKAELKRTVDAPPTGRRKRRPMTGSGGGIQYAAPSRYNSWCQ
jgi:F-type H+-transporting ATPase subunit b